MDQPPETSRRDELAAEIRFELRSIVRQLDDLQRPIGRFEPSPDSQAARPAYYVHFNDRPRRRINGLRIGSKEVSLPDERIEDAVFSAAKAIWHLKDRLRKWCKLQRVKDEVEDYAKRCPDLLICADLANWKKHGERLRTCMKTSTVVTSTA